MEYKIRNLSCMRVNAPPPAQLTHENCGRGSGLTCGPAVAQARRLTHSRPWWGVPAAPGPAPPARAAGRRARPAAGRCRTRTPACRPRSPALQRPPPGARTGTEAGAAVACTWQGFRPAEATLIWHDTGIRWFFTGEVDLEKLASSTNGSWVAKGRSGQSRYTALPWTRLLAQKSGGRHAPVPNAVLGRNFSSYIPPPCIASTPYLNDQSHFLRMRPSNFSAKPEAKDNTNSQSQYRLFPTRSCASNIVNALFLDIMATQHPPPPGLSFNQQTHLKDWQKSQTMSSPGSRAAGATKSEWGGGLPEGSAEGQDCLSRASRGRPANCEVRSQKGGGVKKGARRGGQEAWPMNLLHLAGTATSVLQPPPSPPPICAWSSSAHCERVWISEEGVGGGGG